MNMVVFWILVGSFTLMLHTLYLTRFKRLKFVQTLMIKRKWLLPIYLFVLIAGWPLLLPIILVLWYKAYKKETCHV